MYPDDYLNREDSATVRFFSSPFDPLNNWSAHQVKLWDKTFPTAAHAYQYKKFDLTDESVAKKIFDAPSPWKAYQIAKEYTAEARDDWDEIKLTIMREILTAKLEQNEDVRERLQKTGSRAIIEDSPLDTFWGCGTDGLGENNLGKIWVSLRSNKA